CAVFHHRFAIGEDGGHQQVFGAGYGDLVEVDVRAFEAVGASFNISVLVGDGCAHHFEALDVEVDGAAADGASAGHGDAGDAGTRDQRAEHKRGSAHGLDDFIFRHRIGEHAAADGGAVLRASVAQLNVGTHGNQELALSFNIAHLRDVLEDDLVFGDRK